MAQKNKNIFNFLKRKMFSRREVGKLSSPEDCGVRHSWATIA